MNNEQSNQICCPKFDPTPWQEKEFSWKDKKFIKDKVFTLFYIPLNFGSAMKRMMNKLEKANIKPADFVCLSEHTSKWSMDVLLAVDKEVPDAENIILNGKYISKVYEGNFKDTGLWHKDFEKYVKEKGLTIKKMYMWYTTCPKCAKKYGKNYTVIIGQLA